MRLLLAIVAALQMSCSVNILQNFANEKTDDALFESAQSSINSGDYSTALTTISSMSSTYASSRAVVNLKASAYAGRCGLIFLKFATALKSLGTTRLFPFLLTNFDGSVASHIDDCETAANLIQSLGALTSLTNDEAVTLLTVEMAKMGNIFSYYTDASPHDGTADPAWDSVACATGGSRAAGGSITDADIRELAASITISMSLLTQLSNVIQLGSGTFNSVTTACGSLTGPLASYNFCGVTDPTAFTTNELQAVRSLVRENSTIGLGTCTGDISTCLCP